MERQENEMGNMSIGELQEFIERCSWSGCGSLQSKAERVLRARQAEIDEMG